MADEPDVLRGQDVPVKHKEARAIAARARKTVARSVEVAEDECWQLYHDEADRLRELADQMHALARNERGSITYPSGERIT